MGINVLSLFDGMSCGQIALERAGIKVDNYYASEIDPYAIKITQKNYPNTIQLGSITEWREWDIKWPDLIIGGSPCQGFSFAGKGLNFQDPRSKLFFTFADILKYYKPYAFLLENVIMKAESNDVISSVLGDIYPECVEQKQLFKTGRLEPIMINSALVSAQNRERLYWTNIPNVAQPRDRGVFFKDIKDNISPQKYLSDSRMEYQRRYHRCIPFVTLETKKLPCLIASYYKQPSDGAFVLEDGRGRLLSPIECERAQTIPDNYTDCVSNSKRYHAVGNGWTIDVIAHIFSYLPKEWRTK